jgi:hypothetical protein
MLVQQHDNNSHCEADPRQPCHLQMLMHTKFNQYRVVYPSITCADRAADSCETSAQTSTHLRPFRTPLSTHQHLVMCLLQWSIEELTVQNPTQTYLTWRFDMSYLQLWATNLTQSGIYTYTVKYKNPYGLHDIIPVLENGCVAGVTYHDHMYQEFCTDLSY